MTSASSEFEIPVQLHSVDGVRERVQAQISRVNTGFIVLSSPSALEIGQKLDMMYLERPIRCEVAYCNRHAERNYRVGARILEGTDGSLRAERRIRFEATAKLKMAGMSAPISVQVMDISSSGLGVKMKHPLEVGALAYVELELGVAFGEIRHCKPFEGGYRAGLFVEEFIARTAGAPNPWVAHHAEARGRGSFSVGSALKSALMPNRKS